MTYKVLQGFRQWGKQFNPGDKYEASEHDARPLLMQKLIGEVEAKPKSAKGNRRGA